MTEKARCPKPKYLIAYIQNKLTKDSRQTVSDHLATCKTCSMIAESLKTTAASSTGSDPGSEKRDAEPASSQTATPVSQPEKSPRSPVAVRPSSFKPVMATLGVVAILATGGFAASQFLRGPTDTPATGAADSDPIIVKNNSTEQPPVQPPIQPSEPPVVKNGPDGPSSKTGFVMSELATDEVIQKISVTITAGPEADIDEIVDLHLGFGFPLRLTALDPADLGPVFAALPTASSLDPGTAKIFAGQTATFEFSQIAEANDRDPLKTSQTLLADLTVAEISQIGFAARGQSDWKIAGYKIEINGKPFAANDSFGKSAKLENVANQEALKELIPAHDATIDEIAQLESVVQTGLATSEETDQLAVLKQNLDGLSYQVQKRGGQILGQYPSIVEYSQLFTPARSENRYSSIRVHLTTNGMEQAGTRNPVFLNYFGRKFLLSSETSPLDDLQPEQVFEVSSVDLEYAPVSEPDSTIGKRGFGIGLLGSNEPFDTIPDRAHLQHVVLEINGVNVFDSTADFADRNSLEKIVLIPPAHRDQTGKIVVNSPGELERVYWTPGIELASSGPGWSGNGTPNNTGTVPISVEAAPSVVPPPPAPSFVLSMPNGMYTPIAPNRRQNSDDALIKQLLTEILARLAQPGTQTAPVATGNTGTGNTGTGNTGTAIPGTAIPGTPIPGTAIPGTPIPGTPIPGTAIPGTAIAGQGIAGAGPVGPVLITPPDQLEIDSVQLTLLQRHYGNLRDGMRPTIEWDAINSDNVKNYQARLWGILPHSNADPVLLSESPRKSSSKSIHLPPINLAESTIPLEQQARLFVQPEIIAFDNNDAVISTGVTGSGPLVPLFPGLSISGPDQPAFRSVAYQVNGDGFGSMTDANWRRLSSVFENSGIDVGYLDEPTNTHIARTFDHMSNAIGISSQDPGVQQLTLRFDSSQALGSNLRLIGHLGFINGPVGKSTDAAKKALNEMNIEARIVVQDVPVGKQPVITANLTTEYRELRIETMAATTYTKVDAQTPMLLIDIPIALDLDLASYDQKLAEIVPNALTAGLKVNPASTLPLGKIENGFVSLTLKIKMKDASNDESLGLFGLRLIRDPVQPPAGISVAMGKTGEAPVDNSVNNPVEKPEIPKLSPEDKTIVQVIGHGYDATGEFANPMYVKANIFGVTGREDYDYQNVVGNATKISTKTGRDTAEYSNSLAVGVKAGAGKGLFSASVSVAVENSESGSESTSFAMVNDTLYVYQARLKSSAKPSESVLKIFNDPGITAYQDIKQKIIQVYGTHYLNDADFGGRIVFETFLDEKTSTNGLNIKTEAEAAYGLFNVAASVESSSSEASSKMSQNSSFHNFGGGATLNQQTSIDTNSYSVWKTRVSQIDADKDNQALVGFGGDRGTLDGLIPLWELPGIESSRRALIETAINRYIKESAVHKPSMVSPIVMKNSTFKLKSSGGQWLGNPKDSYLTLNDSSGAVYRFDNSPEALEDGNVVRIQLNAMRSTGGTPIHIYCGTNASLYLQPYLPVYDQTKWTVSKVKVGPGPVRYGDTIRLNNVAWKDNGYMQPGADNYVTTSKTPYTWTIIQP